MKHDDPRIEELLAKMQKLIGESRLLKKRYDELTDEYLKLEREFEERMARTRIAE